MGPQSAYHLRARRRGAVPRVRPRRHVHLLRRGRHDDPDVGRGYGVRAERTEEFLDDVLELRLRDGDGRGRHACVTLLEASAGAASDLTSTGDHERRLNTELKTLLERDRLFTHDKSKVGRRKQIAVDLVCVVEDDLSSRH